MKRKSQTRVEPKGPPVWALFISAALVVLYVGALLFRRDQVPAGLCNDTAEEALRGMLLASSHRFEPITFALGNSAETLYLYFVGWSTMLFGPTTLAIQLISWFCCGATLWLLVGVVKRISPAIPFDMPLYAGLTSIWLFHYARAGLRAISAPMFFLAFVFFLLRAQTRKLDAILAGVILGLGIYSYTALRILPIAWLVHVVWALLRSGKRGEVLRSAALTGLAMAVVSIPNLIFFVDHPSEFLLRGSYVLQGGVFGNIAATALLPFVYFDSYNTIVGPFHYFDGVSVGLTTADIWPVHPLTALLALAGVVTIARHRDRFDGIGIVGITWLVGVLLLGVAGPSLTRNLVLLPVFLIFAAVGAARFGRSAAMALFAIVLLGGGYAYFAKFGSDPSAQLNFSPVATPMGTFAAQQARQGKRILCVVAKDRNVIRYLTYDTGPLVTVVEFYDRPLSLAEIPRDAGVDLVLIEEEPAFAAVDALFPAARSESVGPFRVLRLPR